MATLYSITNTVNGKLYLGKTSVEPILRWRDHRKNLRGNRHDNDHLQKAWNKYGESVFVFAIVQTFATCEEANSAEIQQILSYREQGIELYNIRGGGDGGLHSEETKEKIRQGQYNRPPDSEETRRKRKEAAQGRILSKEHRRKVSERGRPARIRTPEEIEKHRQAIKGRPLSKEHKTKLSLATKGKPKSETARLNISVAVKKRWEEYRKRKIVESEQISLDL